MSEDQATRPTTLLLADDDDDLRAMLRLVLPLEGFQIVGEAVDGSEALALTRKHRPDVVVLDLNMPDLHGSAVIDQLREGDDPQAAAIVVYSGDVVDSSPVHCSPAHGVSYVAKGGSVAELVAVVRTSAS